MAVLGVKLAPLIHGCARYQALALAADQRDRYPTAAALEADLHRWLAGEPIPPFAAAPASVSEQTPLPTATPPARRWWPWG